MEKVIEMKKFMPTKEEYQESVALVTGKVMDKLIRFRNQFRVERLTPANKVVYSLANHLLLSLWAHFSIGIDIMKQSYQAKNKTVPDNLFLCAQITGEIWINALLLAFKRYYPDLNVDFTVLSQPFEAYLESKGKTLNDIEFEFSEAENNDFLSIIAGLHQMFQGNGPEEYRIPDCSYERYRDFVARPMAIVLFIFSHYVEAATFADKMGL